MAAIQVVSESFGNGRLDPGEACDDGNQEDRDGCRRHCAVAVCGDGTLRIDRQPDEAGFEACDDGNGVDEDNFV